MLMESKDRQTDTDDCNTTWAKWLRDENDQNIHNVHGGGRDGGGKEAAFFWTQKL